MTTTPYLLGLVLEGRQVLVVGGGAVAARRVPKLLDAGADVLLVAPDVTPVLDDLARRGLLRWQRREYRDGDCAGAWLAQACTSDPAVNAAVTADAESRGIWCVRADDRRASAAWTPATGREGDVTVGVLTGSDPKRAARVRDTALEVARQHPAIPDPDTASTGPEGPESAPLEASLYGGNAPGDAPGRAAGKRPAGGSRSGVALVGGGPGNPGLITVRGRRLLDRATVVVVDRLAPRELLDELGSHVEVIDAAKIPYGRSVTQQRIHQLLVDRARAGHFVVRLKGGDPFAFGRGAEEVLACAREGVPVEVVPGITSATAAPAAANVPVTHRGVAQQFTVVSAHLAPDDPRSMVDWQSIGRSGGTLVLLMAVRRIGAVAEALTQAGRDPETPVRIIQDGTLPTQRLLTATLGTVARESAARDIHPPAIIVVGDVVNVAREIEVLRSTGEAYRVP